jgi:hypothetical protein
VNNTYGFTGRTRSKRVDHLEWTWHCEIRLL